MKKKFEGLYEYSFEKQNPYKERNIYRFPYVKNPLEEKKVSVLPFFGEFIEDSELKIILNIDMTASYPKYDSNEYHTIDIDSMLINSIYIGRIFANKTQIGTIEKYRHQYGTTSFNTIALYPEYHKKGFGYRCIKLLLQNAKEHKSNKFIIQNILSEKEGLEFKDNLKIFKKIAEKLKEMHEIEFFEFQRSEYCSRTNLILIL